MGIRNGGPTETHDDCPLCRMAAEGQFDGRDDLYELIIDLGSGPDDPKIEWRKAGRRPS